MFACQQSITFTKEHNFPAQILRTLTCIGKLTISPLALLQVNHCITIVIILNKHLNQLYNY